MSVIKKTLFAENLDRYNVLVNDTDVNSKYFKITELSDTFTGGKNAFLIQGSQYLVADTIVKIELKDAAGNIIYHEPGEGLISSSINGEPIVTEYYEGTSKVVSVYVYPDTAYGPCTLTILGELSSYDNNGLNTPVPIEWEGQYNVKWQKQINVNPALANTTKIRFYKRPTANITETIQPIYQIISGSKVSTGINQSFANVKLSNLETFAGDVKRVKVFRTSQGDISDYDLIQDIYVEAKELLTTYDLTSSVVGLTGIFNQQVLENFWNTGSLVTQLTSSRVENGLKLSGSGNLTYSEPLDLISTNTYELNLDAFYSGNLSTNLGIYVISGSDSSSIATLNGISPTKNLLDSTYQFKLNTDYISSSLYFSQSNGEWHVGNISLKLTEDTAFNPDEINFITTMPTVVGNETYNFKFEFYDVNNNFVPVAVTQSATFTGGTTIQSLATSIDSSSLASSASLYAVSQSISGTAALYLTTSIATSSVYYTSSLQTSSLYLTASLQTSSLYLTASIATASYSASVVSASVYILSSSISQSVYNGLLTAFNKVQDLADGEYSGSFISGNIIYAPVIGGQLGYFSTLFKVGATNSIYLDARTSTRKIFVGGVNDTGSYNSGSTSVYMDSNGYFSLKDKLTFDPTANAGTGGLTVGGTINATAGTFSGTITATGTISGGTITGATFSAGTISGGTIRIGSGTSVFSADSNGLYLGNTTFASAPFRVTPGGALTATGATITGALVATSLTLQSGVTVPNTSITGLGTLSTLNSVNATYIDDNSITTNKVVANTLNASHISALDFTGKTATFNQGTIGGWTINPDKLSSPPDGSGYSRLTFSPSPLIAVNNTSGDPKLKIRAGDLTNLGAGTSATIPFGSNNVSSWSDNQSNIGSQFLYGSGFSFSVSAAGNYSGTVGMSGATGTVATTPGVWGGYLYVGIGYQIASDSGFNSIIATGVIGSASRGTPGSLSIPNSSNVISVSFPTSGTYYARIYWNRVLYSNTTATTSFNSNSSNVTNSSIGSSVEATELTDKGFQVVNSTTYWMRILRDGYSTGAFVQVGGDISATGNIIAYASDKRLKENLTPIQSPLDKVDKLNGVHYKWKDEVLDMGFVPESMNDTGLLAQEVLEVLPDAVKPAPFDLKTDSNESKSGENYLTVQYEKVVPLLVEAIKELRRELNELKSK